MTGYPRKVILKILLFFIFAGLIFSLGASGSASIISPGHGRQPLISSNGTETAIEIDNFYSCEIEGIIIAE